MPRNLPQHSAFDDPIVKWLAGFFGALFGFLLLPRALKFTVRRFVMGTVGEIVAIILTGLLTEKAVEFMNKEDDGV